MNTTPTEREKILAKLEKIVRLAADIRLTNNGYLFAPTAEQIELAKENPKIFKYTYSSFSFLPHKIELA